MTPVQMAPAGTPAPRSIERAICVSVSRPRAVVAIWAAVVAVSAALGQAIEIDRTTSSFLDRESREWQVYQYSVGLFGGDEFVTVAVTGAEPFGAEAVESITRLTHEIAAIEGVRRVDSVSTLPVVRRAEDGMILMTPALTAPPRDNAARAAVADAVLNDRLSLGSTASSDGRTLALTAVLDADIDGDREAIVSEIESIVAAEDAWVSGVPVFRTKVNSRTVRELVVLGPITLGFIVIGLWLAFGQLSAPLIAFACSICGIGVTAGAMSISGTPVSLSTMTLPPILIALGSAYATHVMSAARGVSGPKLAERLVAVGTRVAWSGVTTSIGFLAMFAVPVAAIRELSSFGALGCLVVTASVLTLAPALLSGGRLSTGGIHDRLGSIVLSVVKSVQNAGTRFVFGAWGVAVVVLLPGLLLLEVNTNIIRWFPSEDPVREDYEMIRERLAGITPMNVVVEARDGARITEPKALEAISRLVDHVSGLGGVGRAVAITDLLGTVNEAVTGSSGLPRTQALAEQFLFLLSGVGQVPDLVSDDRSVANIVVKFDVNDSRELVQFRKDIEGWWAEYGAEGFALAVTGIMYEFARAQEGIAQGQLWGLLAAFSAVFVILCGVLKSGRLGAAAVVPNVVPIVLAYGLMGVLGISIDAATVCIGAVAIGIAVDDTVHIVTGYQAARGRMKPKEAMEEVLARTTPALTLSTLSIAAGFLVLSSSSFEMIQNFGMVTAGIVALCLVADLTLLPAMISAVERRSGAL